jgi:hypothetical protein
MTGNEFKCFVLSLTGTEQVPHFKRIGFKIAGKRMFATYLERNSTVNIFLEPAEQSVFCNMNIQGIYPVPNKWGEKGATTFELKTVPKEILKEAVYTAYKYVLQSRH